ncbi:unnamed protein product [Cuscuta europaea]|uniref:Phototropic-responsive NPH3 family protein n=1 Tax=Cuscuta europaea TaxID=41803 RepID=A0A9P0YUV1_CUSEU|nr:unnamed protein product [Cuscuta europaea]
MKFMKIGARPDTFYTEDGTRVISSDMPSDLTIKINNITYHLHKYPLLQKCGLLQRLISNTEDSDNVTLELHDTPGGEEALEICAKFCYGMTINVSAHNFVPVFCAAKFLRMTEAFEKGNLAVKLEAFLASCVLGGWKDSILALQTTEKLADWAENVGVTRKCIDSIVEKILTPPAKVRWSYTCSRHGFDKKQVKSAPRDWWTEDLAVLGIDLFRCIVTTVRSSGSLPPQLIGEALHVYAGRWLPNTRKSKLPSIGGIDRKRNILETIVSMIPSDGDSVSLRFLLKLLSAANYLGASMVAKAELIRRSGERLHEARVNDLLLPPSQAGDETGSGFDVELVGVVLESFLRQWKRQAAGEEKESAMRKVGKLMDCYVQVVARDDPKMAVEKLVSLASAVPDVARPLHDELYQAVNIYLKVHPNLSKADRKLLCRILDCRKLSPEVCAHAVRNERLPLRTVVQVLYFEQERGAARTTTPIQLSTPKGDFNGLGNKLKLDSDDQRPQKATDENQRRRRRTVVHDDEELQYNCTRLDVSGSVSTKGREIGEEKEIRGSTNKKTLPR